MDNQEQIEEINRDDFIESLIQDSFNEEDNYAYESEDHDDSYKADYYYDNDDEENGISFFRKKKKPEGTSKYTPSNASSPTPETQKSKSNGKAKKKSSLSNSYDPSYSDFLASFLSGEDNYDNYNDDTYDDELLDDNNDDDYYYNDDDYYYNDDDNYYNDDDNYYNDNDNYYNDDDNYYNDDSYYENDDFDYLEGQENSYHKLLEKLKEADINYSPYRKHKHSHISPSQKYEMKRRVKKVARKQAKKAIRQTSNDSVNMMAALQLYKKYGLPALLLTGGLTNQNVLNNGNLLPFLLLEGKGKNRNKKPSFDEQKLRELVKQEMEKK
ncbi:hypothetical protein TRFO_27939 [Tritrichomonas foetus]|uniref:Uncharacterized protein n=1 Tax=Tritrichomonas foetus TaxID=1144522 RepID=A0A1J4K0S3_9EUKA|nr:hypothetical protein TRFO_27939 [Tritrichomonas foetus]|eukprot:OHT04554.1 hypothetical protein TRFO_27939 [Tritrichomonas foetus]